MQNTSFGRDGFRHGRLRLVEPSPWMAAPQAAQPLVAQQMQPRDVRLRQPLSLAAFSSKVRVTTQLPVWYVAYHWQCIGLYTQHSIRVLLYVNAKLVDVMKPLRGKGFFRAWVGRMKVPRLLAEGGPLLFGEGDFCPRAHCRIHSSSSIDLTQALRILHGPRCWAPWQLLAPQRSIALLVARSEVFRNQLSLSAYSERCRGRRPRHYARGVSCRRTSAPQTT